MENAEPIANSRKRWLPFALLIAGYALIDFVVTAGAGAYLIKSDFPSLVGLSVILGCFLAQLGALAAWGALGTCRAIIGWVTTLFVSEILLALLVVADIYFFDEDQSLHNLRDYAELFQLLPLAFSSAQIPLWAIRYALRFRIVVVSDAPAAREQLTLRNIFIATAIVSALVALLQIDINGNSASQVAGWAVGSVIAGVGFGLLALLPFLWGALGSRVVARGCFAVVAYVGIAASAYSAIVYWALSSDEEIGPPSLSDTVSIIGAVFIAFALTLHGSLLVLRYNGYSLRRIKSELTEPLA